MNLSEPQIIDFAGCPTVVVRREQLSTDDLVSFVDASFTALGEAIREGQFHPIGPGFTRWDTPMGDAVTVEVGFPVEEPWADARKIGETTLQPSELPAGRTAVAELKGDLADVANAWKRMRERMEERELPIGRPCWEYYDVPPSLDRDPRHQRTRLCAPLAS